MSIFGPAGGKGGEVRRVCPFSSFDEAERANGTRGRGELRAPVVKQSALRRSMSRPSMEGSPEVPCHPRCLSGVAGCEDFRIQGEKIRQSVSSWKAASVSHVNGKKAQKVPTQTTQLSVAFSAKHRKTTQTTHFSLVSSVLCSLYFVCSPPL